MKIKLSHDYESALYYCNGYAHGSIIALKQDDLRSAKKLAHAYKRMLRVLPIYKAA